MIKAIEPYDDIEERLDTTSPTLQFFGPDSPLRRARELGGRNYEERPQQVEMAIGIAAALDKAQHLCVEAPTGVGKTFAYLAPAIYHAVQTGLPVVVSTHTISLQEQIIERDLPLLTSLLDTDFKYAIAKGRSNYVCLRRLHAAADEDQDYLPDPELIPQVQQIRQWALTSEDGSKSSLDFEPRSDVWDTVCCEGGNCMNAACPQFRACFLMRARRKLMNARVIVANHALFFADLAMKMEGLGGDIGILPHYGAVILDEAHSVEDTAAVQLGVRVSGYGVRRALRRLYNPERQRGLLKDDFFQQARTAVTSALEKSERFFRQLHDWASQQQENPVRYGGTQAMPDMLGGVLEEVYRATIEVAKDEDDDGRRQELCAVGEQIAAYKNSIHAVLNMQLENHVYWFERFGPGQRGISLNAVPIDIGSLLAECLFNQDFTVIMTSATLAVRGNMQYFQQRIGAENSETLMVTSPFDFEKQVSLYIARDLPPPNDAARFVPAACELMKRFLKQTDGKAFVLFTSYRMMRDAAEELREFCAECDFRLLVQGEGIPRSRMLDSFRADVNSVIFGTASFWTGVDVPGEALSNVMIVRLPFSVPDHPLIAARHEMIEKQGGNAFWKYSLPEAVLKFRQGVGRLIRTRDDRGIIVVLDNRVVRARYGRAFLDSIPKCHTEMV